ARSFWRAHFLTLSEKLRIVFGLAALRFTNSKSDPPLQDWLIRRSQTSRTMDRFWGLILTSALNETSNRIGLRYVRKVFVDAFLRRRRGFEVEIPMVPLGRLYGEELERWFQRHDVKLLLHSAVKKINVSQDHVHSVEMREGNECQADWYISAVPFDRLLDLLPSETIAAHPTFSQLRNLEVSPITSIHLWWDRP